MASLEFSCEAFRQARGGHIGSAGVWLSGKPDFPAENEEINVCVLVHLVVEFNL